MPSDQPPAPPGFNELPPLRLEWVDPATLAENPQNWRRHPREQLAALTDVLAEVGWAGACLFNELTGRLIDGHARRKVALEQGSPVVPVLVGRWTEEQERKILATLDPLAAKAEADPEKLAALVAQIDTESDAIAKLLADLVPEAEEPAADEPDTSPQLGGLEYRIVIECESEQHQAAIIQRLEGEGLKCRPLMS